MTPEEWAKFKQKGCLKKVPFASKQDAEAAVVSIKNSTADGDKHNERLCAYRCKFGKHFHVGHRNKRYMPKLRDDTAQVPAEDTSLDSVR